MGPTSDTPTDIYSFCSQEAAIVCYYAEWLLHQPEKTVNPVHLKKINNSK